MGIAIISPILTSTALIQPTLVFAIKGQYAEAEKFAAQEGLQIINYYCNRAKT